MLKTVSINEKILMKYPTPETMHISDLLSLAQGEKKYSELLGYSFYEDMNTSEKRKVAKKKVVIWEDEKGKLLGWDYFHGCNSS